MKGLATSKSSWNDRWNNHVRFYTAMEAILRSTTPLDRVTSVSYKVLCKRSALYFKHRLQNYAKELLPQVHILDTKAADPILRNAYIYNALINSRG